MTTNHHDPHPFGAPLTSAEINRPHSELDAAIEQVITTGSGASTTLTAQANAAQPNLVVASVAELAIGDMLYIGRAGDTYESHAIDNIVALTITLDANLANTYAAGTPVSKSPVEIVDARDTYSSLADRLDKLIGGLAARGAGGLVGTDAASTRIPLNWGAVMDGEDIVAAGGSSNIIAHNFTATFNGDLAGIGGLDPGYVWGMSLFSTVGPGATDGDGIIDLTSFVSEIAVQSSAADQGVIRAGHFSTSLWGVASGGHIDQIEGIRIGTPAFKDGALTGNWTIDNVYGLLIEDPGAVGTTRWALFTAGGPSRFNGRLDVLGHLVQNAQMTLGGTSNPAGGVAGDIFYRTDRRSWYFHDGTNWVPIYAVPGRARIVAPVAIANTFTKVLGYAIPANYVVAGTSFRIKAYGRLTTGGTPGSSVFQVYMPGVNPVTITIANAASKTNAPFVLDALVTIRTIGASGTAVASMSVHGGTTIVPFTPTGDVATPSATVLYNSTIAGNVEFFYTSGNAGSTATFEEVTIELVAME